MLSPSNRARRRSACLALVLGFTMVRVTGQCLNWQAFPTDNATDSTPPSIRSATLFDDGSGSALYLARTLGPNWADVVRVEGQDVEPLIPAFQGSVLKLFPADLGGGSLLYSIGYGNLSGQGPALLASWNGTSWQTLGASVSLGLGSLAAVLHDDGSGAQIYIAGQFAAVSGVPVSNIARWDGTSWSTVGAGIGGAFFTTVYALAIHDQGNGPQLFAGSHTTGGPSVPAVARWDGTTWIDAGSGLMQSGVRRLVDFDDGSGPALFAASNSYDTPSSWGLGRLQAGVWSRIPLPPTANAATVGELAVADDGTGPALYIVTRETYVLQTWKLSGSTWAPVGSPFRGTCGESVGEQARLLLPGSFDLGSGPRMYAAPHRAVVAEGSVGAWLRLENGDWHAALPAGTGIESVHPVRALLSHDDGTGPAVYASGSFCRVGGVEAVLVARLKGDAWEGLSFPQHVYVGGGPYVSAFAVGDLGAGPTLFAGGRFGLLDTVLSYGAAQWTGSEWIGLGGSLMSGTNSVQTMLVADVGAGPLLYAGGSFTVAGGTASPNFAAWDGTNWNALPPGGTAGVNGQVLALTEYDAGTGPRVYLGGTFTQQTGGAPLSHIASWDGTQLSPVGLGTNAPVESLITFDDGSGPNLYAGGAFTSAGGAPAGHIARYDGTSWSALGAGFDGGVTALAVFDDGSGPALYAAGNFTASGTTPLPRIARWNGSTWSALANGVAPAVAALAAHTDASGERRLFVGGTLSTAGVIATSNIAAWRACDDLLERFCVADGTTTVCPCDNAGLAARGCNNSANTGGARLNAMGSASLDTISLHAAGETPNAATLVFQGDVLRTSPTPFGDGLLCLGGNLKRLYTLNASAGQITVPGVGQLSLSQRSAQLGDVLTPGSVRGYQAWYRDANAAFCSAPLGANWNLTNGVRVVW